MERIWIDLDLKIPTEWHVIRGLPTRLVGPNMSIKEYHLTSMIIMEYFTPCFHTIYSVNPVE